MGTASGSSGGPAGQAPPRGRSGAPQVPSRTLTPRTYWAKLGAVGGRGALGSQASLAPHFGRDAPWNETGSRFPLWSDSEQLVSWSPRSYRFMVI